MITGPITLLAALIGPALAQVPVRDEPPELPPAPPETSAPEERAPEIVPEVPAAPEPDPPAPAPPEPTPPEPAALPPGGSGLSGAVYGFGRPGPLPGARVRISGEGESVEVYTSVTGGFSVPLPPGRYTVEVWSEGFEPFASEERLTEGELLSLSWKLRPVEEGIVITAERVRSEVSRTVVTMDELASVPGAFGDPIRALQTLPGVARPSALEGDLAVRGAEAGNTAYFVDDLPVPYMFHLLVGRSVLNPAVVRGVEFYPGGLPSDFGDSLQAAVNVRSSDPRDRSGGVVSADVLDGSLALSRALSDTAAIRVAGRYSWVSALLKAYSARVVESGEQDAVYLNPRYWDAWADLRWSPVPGHDIALLGFGARDAFLLDDPTDVEVELPFDPDLLVDSYFARGQLRWDYAGERYKQSTWAALGPEREQSLFEPGLLPAEGPSQGRVEGSNLMVRHEDTWRVNDALSLEDGFRLISYDGTAWDYADALVDPTAEIAQTDEARQETDAWLEARVIAGGWNLAPGVRYATWQWNGRTDAAPQPRFTARYQLGERWWVKGFAGRFAQLPALEQYAEGMGDPELPLQTSTQLVGGVEGEFGGAWFLDASIWQTWMQDLVVQDLTVAARSNGQRTVETLDIQYDAVQGRAYGLELLLRLKPQQRTWWGWLALSAGRALRTDDSGATFYADRDQPIAATLLAAWDLPYGWQLSGRARYTSGHPFTPYYGVYDPDEQEYRPLAGEHNSDRFQPFRQLDARVQKTWVTPRRDWMLYLDVFNATWVKNPFAAAYNYDYTELVPLYSIPVLPILGVQCSF